MSAQYPDHSVSAKAAKMHPTATEQTVAPIAYPTFMFVTPKLNYIIHILQWSQFFVNKNVPFLPELTIDYLGIYAILILYEYAPKICW